MSQVASSVPIIKAGDKAVADSYIVMLKEDADMDSHLAWVQDLSHRYAGTSSKCEIVHRYQFLRGYSAHLSGPALDELVKRDDVKSIQEDCEGELDGIDDVLNG